VSLPEVPLLGVLPGTGGLTRLTDKRRARRDHADIFCTLVEGVRAQRAQQWRLIDGHAKPQQFAQTVKERAQALATTSDRAPDAKGIELVPLSRTVDDSGYHYEHVDVRIDRRARCATLTVSAPKSLPAEGLTSIIAAGASWWPLAMARELDDAILLLRTNELDIGTWVLKTSGDASHVLAVDATLLRHGSHWFVRETIGMLRRTLARLDVTSRTLFALIEPGSCFAGTLFELALAADRSYMLAVPDVEAAVPKVVLSALNFGSYPMVNGHPRLVARFYGETEPMAGAKKAIGRALPADAALELGLITAAPDELDWADEVRVALEERASLSPDALTGMEANLRFGGVETMETRVFGRLSAWQNWIFIRPNAVGETGALKVFGTGNKARFNWDRV
jgi:benzoyl-CoA-dihydrodiol lyase